MTPAGRYEYTYDWLDVIRERGPSGVRLYVHGPWIDEPLAEVQPSGIARIYHADGLGSIIATTDASGAVTSRRQYDAWGNLEVGADQPGYAFTGREWDPETGLYYYRARYYDPKIGRFISEDPLGLAAGPNSYAYADARPTGTVDPLGLFKCDCMGPAPKDPGPDASWWQKGLYLLQLLTRPMAVMPGPSIIAAPEMITVQAATTFIGQVEGPAIAVPAGAAGPMAVRSGKGIMWVGGSMGANGQVWGVRVMNPTTLNPTGYVSYFNNGMQAVDYVTGQTLAKSDLFWHLPLGQCVAR